MNMEAAIQIIHNGATTVQRILTALNNRAASSADFPEMTCVVMIYSPCAVDKQTFSRTNLVKSMNVKIEHQVKN